MKSVKMTIAVVVLAVLSGCASSPFPGQNDTVRNEKVFHPETGVLISESNTAQGRGVDSIIIQQNTNRSERHDSSPAAAAARERASIAEACKSFPNHPRCKS